MLKTLRCGASDRAIFVGLAFPTPATKSHKRDILGASAGALIAALVTQPAAASDVVVSGFDTIAKTLTGTDTLEVTSSGALDVPIPANGIGLPGAPSFTLITVLVDSGATNVSIVNDGLIDGHWTPVSPAYPPLPAPTILFTAPAGSLLTIENNGEIEGLAAAIGVSASGTGAVNLTNTGDIYGHWHPAVTSIGPVAVSLGAGADTFTNSGYVEGHVLMGLGADTVNILTGSEIDGVVFGGAVAYEDIGPASLALSPGTLNLIGSINTQTPLQEMGRAENFHEVNVVSGYWTLTENIYGGSFSIGDGATIRMENTASTHGEFVYSLWPNDDDIFPSLHNDGHIIYLNDAESYTVDDGLNVAITGDGALDLYNVNANGVFLFNATGGFGGGLNLHGGTVLVTNDYTGDISVLSGGALRIGGNLIEDPLDPGTDSRILVAGGGTTGNVIGDLTIDGTLIFDRSDSFTFGGDLSGSGLIVKQGAGTTTLSGDFNYTGDMQILGGFMNLTGNVTNTGTTSIGASQLNVNGSMSSNISVGAGGELGGAGEINGNVTVGSGGTVSPGNSPGTLDVAGNFEFSTGSTYEIETLPNGVSDRINVTGGGITIQSGTTASILAGGSPYNWSTTYAVLTSTGGISGQFSTVTSNLAFLDASLDYTSSDVMLTLTRNDVDFEDEAETSNQSGVAGAIGNLPGGNDVLLAILNSGTGEAADNFDQLSGEMHASTQSVGLMGSDAFLGQLQGRTQGLVEGVKPFKIASISSGVDVPDQHETQFWAEAFGSTGSLDGDTGAAGLDFDRQGLTLGFDAAPGSNSRLGVAASYHRGDVEVSDRSSSADVSAYDLALYGGLRAGPLVWRGALGVSARGIDTERDVVVGMLTEHLTAEYDARAILGELEISRPFEREGGSFAPFLGLSHVLLDSDGYTETGGASALTVASSDTAVSSATVGGRASRDALGGSLFGSLAWRHSWGDLAPETRMTFASTPGATFTVAGAPIAENAALVEAGYGASLGGMLLEASYRGQLANGGEDHGGRVRATWRF